MDDPAFWRDAARRFIDCDPRGYIEMLWEDGGTEMIWLYSGAPQADFDRLDALVEECGRALNPQSDNPKVTWWSRFSVDLIRHGNHYHGRLKLSASVKQDGGKLLPGPGFCNRIAEGFSRFCEVLESEAIDQPVEHFAPPLVGDKWAVCTRHQDADLRQPQFFETESAAIVFKLGPVLYKGQDVHWRDVGWHYHYPIVPVVIADQCLETFQEFYPLSKIPTVMFAPELPELIDDSAPKVTCFLDGSWNFEAIERDAEKRQGHRYKSLKHASIPELIAKAAYDFDAAIRKVHPGISCKSVADFFSSWQFWRYIAKFATDAGDSNVAVALVGDQYAARDQARDACERIYEQFCSFSHVILSQIPPPTAMEIVLGDSISLSDEPIGTGLKLAAVANPSSAPSRKTRIERLLDDRGWSVNEWATEAQVDFHTANDYMHGRTTPIRRTRKKLADAFGLEVAELP